MLAKLPSPFSSPCLASVSWLVWQLATIAPVGDWVGEEPVAVSAGVLPRTTEGDEPAELEQLDSVTSIIPMPRARARRDIADRAGTNMVSCSFLNSSWI